MGMTKLTLSVDKDLVEEAKKLARDEGTSLSSLFRSFLNGAVRGRKKGEGPGPVTRRATGLVRLPSGKNDRELLEEALVTRYARR
jgi:hypothetical protein